MRKRQITPNLLDVPSQDEGWLDLDCLAVVEVTSEDKEYPVESALAAAEVRGWRAADSGTQTLPRIRRSLLDLPGDLRRHGLSLFPPPPRHCAAHREESDTPRQL
jgi:hypothetical protein